jgi:hypothetical protein
VGLDRATEMWQMYKGPHSVQIHAIETRRLCFVVAKKIDCSHSLYLAETFLTGDLQQALFYETRLEAEKALSHFGLDHDQWKITEHLRD